MSDVSRPFSLARYVSEAAPGGLALVQGILNTRATSSGAEDLLDDTDSATAWLGAAVAEWGSRTGSAAVDIAIDSGGLGALRNLRKALRSYVAGERDLLPDAVPIAIVARADGSLRTQPSGSGISWVESAAWGAVLMAQELGTLRRLKLCRNAVCGAAFYDRSKNSSGVWHDVRMCGNAANLRASRARRRDSATGR
jgi:predicted RNA-binding Zn ribbon-like protein